MFSDPPAPPTVRCKWTPQRRLRPLRTRNPCLAGSALSPPCASSCLCGMLHFAFWTSLTRFYGRCWSPVPLMPHPCVPPLPCLLLSFLAAGHAEPTDSDDFNAQVCGRGVQTTVHLSHSSGYAVRLLVQVMSIWLTLPLSPQ